MQRLPKPWLCLPLQPSTGFKAGVNSKAAGRGKGNQEQLWARRILPGELFPMARACLTAQRKGVAALGLQSSPWTSLLLKAPSRSHGRDTVPSPAGSLCCSSAPPRPPFGPCLSGDNPFVARWCKVLVTNCGLGKTVGISSQPFGLGQGRWQRLQPRHNRDI